MSSKEDAKLVLTAKVRVADRPTLIVKWTPQGCQNLSVLDVAIYWVLLPGLPLQCLGWLERIGTHWAPMF